MSNEDGSVNIQDPGPANDDELTTLRRERQELYERLLRTTAEFDNYRKRTDRERRDLSEAAASDLIRELLPVVDDLERAIAARPHTSDAGHADAVTAHWQGVELILRQFLEVLRKRGVDTFEVLGHDFDPSWHEAIGSEPADGRRDGEIVAEIRRGYRIGQRLLRPALVKVARS
jgi:molecular chaperone GrpE